MVKHLAKGLKGVFRGNFLLQDKNKVYEYVGQSQIGNYSSLTEMKEGARLHVIYQHSNRLHGTFKSGENYIVRLKSGKFIYLGTTGRKPLIKIKRENRTIKARRVKKNGKYIIQQYDKEDNYVINEVPWIKENFNLIKQTNNKKTKTHIFTARDTRTKKPLTKEFYKPKNI